MDGYLVGVVSVFTDKRMSYRVGLNDELGGKMDIPSSRDKKKFVLNFRSFSNNICYILLAARLVVSLRTDSRVVHNVRTSRISIYMGSIEALDPLGFMSYHLQTPYEIMGA